MDFTLKQRAAIGEEIDGRGAEFARFLGSWYLSIVVVGNDAKLFCEIERTAEPTALLGLLHQMRELPDEGRMGLGYLSRSVEQYCGAACSMA